MPFTCVSRLDHFLVGQRRQFLEDHRAVPCVTGQIADVGRFLCGKSQRPHARRAQLQNGFGRHSTPCRGDQAAENHAGHPPAELLVNNGLNQRLEIRDREIGYHNRQPVR